MSFYVNMPHLQNEMLEYMPEMSDLFGQIHQCILKNRNILGVISYCLGQGSFLRIRGFHLEGGGGGDEGPI
jgi:hypothetical protein